MNKLFLFLFMIFLHIVDDFYLQGILAKMKQKSWWKTQSNYQSLYKYDYICALLAHSFSWTFMIMLPTMLYYHFVLNRVFIILFVINILIHCLTDTMKANYKSINLCFDQSIHIIQIIYTFIILIFGELGGI